MKTFHFTIIYYFKTDLVYTTLVLILNDFLALDFHVHETGYGVYLTRQHSYIKNKNLKNNKKSREYVLRTNLIGWICGE